MQKNRKGPYVTLNLGYMPDIRIDQYGYEEDFGCEEIVPAERYMPDTHCFLLDFIDKDLSDAEELISRAVSEGDKVLADKAGDILYECHPYFRDYPAARDGYIAKSLACEIYRRNLDKKKTAHILGQLGLDAEWYFNEETWSEYAVKGTIGTLLQAQRVLRRKVVLLLSDVNPELASASELNRIGLYALLSSDPSSPSLTESEIRMQDILSVPFYVRTMSARIDFEEDYALQYINAVDKFAGNEADLPEILKDIIKDEDPDGEDKTGICYTADYLEDILDIEFRDMFYSGIRVKRCKRCGRYFPVTDLSDELCLVLDKAGGRSCYLLDLEERLGPEINRIYKRAYKTHHDRIKAGHETKEDVDCWREKAKAMQQRVYDGKMDAEEYKARVMAPARDI